VHRLSVSSLVDLVDEVSRGHVGPVAGFGDLGLGFGNDECPDNDGLLRSLRAPSGRGARVNRRQSSKLVEERVEDVLQVSGGMPD
jgi:hypothetical protein